MKKAKKQKKKKKKGMRKKMKMELWSCYVPWEKKQSGVSQTPTYVHTVDAVLHSNIHPKQLNITLKHMFWLPYGAQYAVQLLVPNIMLVISKEFIAIGRYHRIGDIFW